MMALARLPSSLKLRSLNPTTILIRVPSGKLFVASATATRTDVSFQVKNGNQALTAIDNASHRPIFWDLPPLLSTISKPKFDKAVLDEELVDGIVERLKTAVKKIVDVETKKFLSKVKTETLSEEDELLVNEMKNDIMRQYFEKPIRYLKSGCSASHEQKIKDLSFLINMLQQSSST